MDPSLEGLWSGKLDKLVDGELGDVGAYTVQAPREFEGQAVELSCRHWPAAPPVCHELPQHLF